VEGFPFVKLISYLPNKGKSHALEAGAMAARNENTHVS